MTKYKIQNTKRIVTKYKTVAPCDITDNSKLYLPMSAEEALSSDPFANCHCRLVDIGCQLLSSSLSSSSSPTLSSSLLDFFHHHWWSSKGFELNSFFPFPRELALIASLLAVVQWKRWQLSGIAKRQRSYLGMWLLWAPTSPLPPPTRFTQISTLPIVTLEALINFLLEIIIIDIF